MKSSNYKPHILIVCSHLNVAGGLERMVVSFANMLSENDYQISILIVGHTKESFYPINNTIKVYLLSADFGIGNHVNYINRKINFVKDILQLNNSINNITPDIAITTEYTLSAATVFGKLNSNIKLICWQHNTFTTKKSFLWDKASKLAYKKVNCIVALNKDEQKQYQIYNPNTIVIPNFIEHQEAPATLQAKQILTIARFDVAKGIDLLLKAASDILTKYPDWMWKLIGKGNLEKEYIHYISTHEIPQNLIQQQPVSDNISEEYKQSAIYVMTSRKELFPMVLLEAMSHGVPCIAFDCDTGPRHIITNSVNGILVEKENPEKLAEAIATLIEDKEKLSQMGKAAFENAKQFSSTIILKKWEELFNKLLPS